MFALAPRKILSNLLKQAQECRTLSSVDTFERLFNHHHGERPQPSKQAMRARRQVKSPRPPIGEIGAAFHKAGFLKPVNHPANGNRFHIQLFGKTALIDPFMPNQDTKHLPLGPCDANHPRSGIERTAHHA